MNSLECQQHTVALRIGFLLDIDLTVDHGHDTVSKLQEEMQVSPMSAELEEFIKWTFSWMIAFPI